jgi:membrane fusion protein, epimerase transport system
VPENADLVIEARVRPEDITHVTADAPADVRLTGFRRRVTPVVDGKVIYVSADRLEDKSANGRENAAYYMAHIRVTPEALHKAGDLQLQAGMPAEVFIKTESRTALEYLVDPITAFLQRSMREH